MRYTNISELLQSIEENQKKPKNFLEIGVFHGVTSRNVCDLLQKINGNDFTFTGVDLFTTESETIYDEIIPQTKFSNTF